MTTYIASGNVLFTSRLGEAKVKAALAQRLRVHAGKDVGVLVRTAAEMADVLAANPYREGHASYAYAIFLDAAPPPDAIARAMGRTGEELTLGKREIYARYPSGAGRSKLRVPAAKLGTARNMNTVAKLAELAAGL